MTMNGGLLFFILMSATSIPGRFISLFYRSYGLSDSQIGFILSTGYVCSAMFSPLINAKADALKDRELVCAIGFSMSLIAFLSHSFAGMLPGLYVFPYLIIISGIYKACGSGTYSLVSAMSLSSLKLKYGHSAHEKFGQDRLWGAVSWALTATSLGIVADKLGNLLFPIYVGRAFFAILFISAVLFMKKIRIEADIESNNIVRPEGRNVSILEAMRILTKGGPPVIVFYLLVFVLNAAMSLVEGLLFLFFDKDLKASHSVEGLSVLITVIFEIPLFAFSPQLLRQLGPQIILLIGAAAYIIRVFGYTIVPKAWVVLLLEPLHGFTVTAQTIAATAFVSDRTPIEIEATSQSLLSAFSRIASVVGTSIGGYVMQRYGSRTLYRSAAILVLAVSIAFLIVDRVYRLSGDESESLLQDESTLT